MQKVALLNGNRTATPTYTKKNQSIVQLTILTATAFPQRQETNGDQEFFSILVL